MLSAGRFPQAPNSDAVLYFAYGANMAQRTLQKRGVRPIDLEPARAPASLSLAFAHRGGYATLIECPLQNSCTEAGSIGFPGPHGVLYTLSSAHFRQIVDRETGYHTVNIAVRTSSGKQVTARAFQSQRLLRLEQSLPPKQQYLDLMLQGARERGLCDEYCRWLEAVPSVAVGTPLGPEYFETQSEVMAKLAAMSVALAGGFWVAGHSP